MKTFLNWWMHKPTTGRYEPEPEVVDFDQSDLDFICWLLTAGTLLILLLI